MKEKLSYRPFSSYGHITFCFGVFSKFSVTFAFFLVFACNLPREDLSLMPWKDWCPVNFKQALLASGSLRHFLRDVLYFSHIKKFCNPPDLSHLSRVSLKITLPLHFPYVKVMGYNLNNTRDDKRIRIWSESQYLFLF